MTRYTITFLVVIAIVVGAGLVWIFSGDDSSPQVETQTPSTSLPGYTSDVFIPAEEGDLPTGKDASAEAVQAAFASHMSKVDKDNIKPEETVISGGYALQVWSGDTTGGVALLKYDSAKKGWIVASLGGGFWSVASLRKEGVPQKNVLALLDGVRHLVR
jgi:hypothetical protein